MTATREPQPVAVTFESTPVHDTRTAAERAADEFRLWRAQQQAIDLVTGNGPASPQTPGF